MIFAPGLGDGVDLLVGPLLLGHLPAGDQALLVEPCERRVDGAETGLVDVAERPLLEGLLDLVAAGVAPAEDAEAEGFRVHNGPL